MARKGRVFKADGCKLYRDDDGNTVIETPSEYTQDYGAVCINPDNAAEKRMYRKVFKTKRVYFPDEYDLAVADQFAQKDNMVLSMNGYSSIKPADCDRYGVEAGAYEEACKAILRQAIRTVREKFEGAHLQLVYGASDMGVDAAIEAVADKFNLELLGFTCLQWLPYTKDNDRPVFVSNTSDEYADYYIRSLDLLITTGGRKQSLSHDVLAACVYGKHIHFVDVMSSLSVHGIVPATITLEDGSTTVDNAAGAFGRNISFFSVEDAISRAPATGDKWDAIFRNIGSVATKVCRQKMSPTRKFGDQ